MFKNHFAIFKARSCRLNTKFYVMHYPENNLNLRIKTKPVTAEEDVTADVWYLYSSDTETRHILLHLPQP